MKLICSIESIFFIFYLDSVTLRARSTAYRLNFMNVIPLGVRIDCISIAIYRYCYFNFNFFFHFFYFHISSLNSPQISLRHWSLLQSIDRIAIFFNFMWNRSQIRYLIFLFFSIRSIILDRLLLLNKKKI